MRWLFKGLMACALAWSAYWGITAWALRDGVSQWLAARDGDGWLVEYDGLETAGYPIEHQTHLLGPVLADPKTGTAWSADWLTLSSAALSPSRQTLVFPDTPQRLSYFDQTLELQAEGLRAGLELAADPALTVKGMALTSGAWVLALSGVALASGDALEMRMTPAETPETYQITADIPAFAPAWLSARFGPAIPEANPLPNRVQTLHLAAQVTFDTPWDRRALEQRRPQPRRIDLQDARLTWGPMALRAEGTLTVDAHGRPLGRITLRAQNWQQMLTRAEDSGLLSSRMRQVADRLVTLLSGRGGAPDQLDLHLSFSRNRVMLGPLPLGPAPRILLH